MDKKPRIPAVGNDTNGGVNAMSGMNPQAGQQAIHVVIPTPAPQHIIHHVQTKAPQQIIVLPTEVSAADKVRKHGSSMEKAAFNSQQGFKRHGITLKDSRSS